MEIIHTSPNKIEKINTKGLFNDCLFFSEDRYVMTASKKVFTYVLEISDDDTIVVDDLKNELIIKDIISDISDMKITEDVNEGLAQQLLTSEVSIFDLIPEGTIDCTEYSEYDWEIQSYQGKCAKLMGFKACLSVDEQGDVWIIPMLGRENDLKLISEC